MTKYSVERITTKKPFALSRLGLSHYLRVGFLPAPLSVYANELVINNYHGAFHDRLDADSGQFTRDLRQFVGILDVDAGMRKGVLAATLDSRIDVAFPFLHPRWVEL